MQIRRFLVQQIIRIARFLFKNTSVERNPFFLSLYRFICFLGFAGHNKEAHFTLLGEKFVAPMSDISMVPSLLNGNYEQAELNYVRNFLKPGMVFVDIGANIGIYSKIAARTVGATGQVFAFEPSIRTLEYLKKNIGHLKNVKIIEKGVGSASGKQTLYVPENNLGCSSILAKDGKPQEIEIVNLDEYFKDSLKIDFIKMDIEGHELEALKGMKKLFKFHPQILLEFNPSFLIANNKDPEEVILWLRENFSEIKYFSGNSGELRKFENISQLKNQIIANLLVSHPTERAQ